MKHILGKLAAVVAVSLMPTVGNAANIEILTYYKPGGGTDQNIQMVKPLIEKQGHSVTVNYMKSCNQAIEYLQANNYSNRVLWHLNADFKPGDAKAKCVLDGTEDRVNAIGISAESPLAVCVSPGKNVSREDLKTKALKLGVAASGAEIFYASKIVETIGNSNITIEKYRGGGKMRKAAKAGDIDLFFATNSALKKVPGHGECFYSSMRNDPMGTPFAGGADAAFPTIANANIIWSNKESGAAVKAVQAALQDSGYVAAIRDMKMTVPAISEVATKVEAYANYPR